MPQASEPEPADAIGEVRAKGGDPNCERPAVQAANRISIRMSFLVPPCSSFCTGMPGVRPVTLREGIVVRIAEKRLVLVGGGGGGAVAPTQVHWCF